MKIKNLRELAGEFDNLPPDSSSYPASDADTPTPPVEAQQDTDVDTLFAEFILLQFGRVLQELRAIRTEVARIRQDIEAKPAPMPHSFTTSLSIAPSAKGEINAMSPEKATGSTPKLLAKLDVQSDKSVNVSVLFHDAEGVPITTYTAYPPQVALPTVAASDATPGPSAFAISNLAVPTVNPDGSLVVANIKPVTPVVLPPAQGVDITVTVASGLTSQTAPVTVDAGTLNIVADPANPGGFVTEVA